MAYSVDTETWNDVVTRLRQSLPNSTPLWKREQDTTHITLSGTPFSAEMTLAFQRQHNFPMLLGTLRSDQSGVLLLNSRQQLELNTLLWSCAPRTMSLEDNYDIARQEHLLTVKLVFGRTLYQFTYHIGMELAAHSGERGRVADFLCGISGVANDVAAVFGMGVDMSVVKDDVCIVLAPLLEYMRGDSAPIFETSYFGPPNRNPFGVIATVVLAPQEIKKRPMTGLYLQMVGARNIDPGPAGLFGADPDPFIEDLNEPEVLPGPLTPIEQFDQFIGSRNRKRLDVD